MRSHNARYIAAVRIKLRSYIPDATTVGALPVAILVWGKRPIREAGSGTPQDTYATSPAVVAPLPPCR